MWILMAFCSAFFAGITSILAKIGIKNVNSTVATAIRTIIILVFSWIIVFIVGAENEIQSISYKNLIFLILSGLATGASWLCYFKALQLGDVNKVTPVDKSSTVLSMILAVIFLGEPLNAYKVVSIVAITVGTYLMISKKEVENKKTDKKWFVFAVLSAFFASLTSILGKVGVSEINSNLATAIRTVVVLVMAWAMVFVEKKENEVKTIDKKSFVFICLSGITTGASWLCYFKALQDGQASVVVPIDKLSILVTILFAYIAFKEKLSKKSFLGLVLIAFGTAILLV